MQAQLCLAAEEYLLQLAVPTTVREWWSMKDMRPNERAVIELTE